MDTDASTDRCYDQCINYEKLTTSLTIVLRDDLISVVHGFCSLIELLDVEL